MATEPNTGLTWQEAGSLTTDALHNQVIDFVSIWVNCIVLAVGQPAPTGSEVDGDRYIVGSGTGPFAMHDDEMAILRGGTWQFHEAQEGVTVHNLADGADWINEGSGGWAQKTSGGGIPDAPADGTTYGRKDNAWEPISASGALEKLVDFTVTTAQQDIDFSSLDLDADASYVIELAYVPAATGDKGIYLYFNADLTATNYNSTLFYSDGAAPSGFAFNNAYAFSSGAGSIYTASAKFEIAKLAGHLPRSRISATGRSTAGLRSMLNNHEWNSTANVTAIKLRHADAGGFAAGTRARLYRMN